MCTPTQGVWQPAGCVSCELVCVCVARACRHQSSVSLASTHTALVGVQSESDCSSPSYTYIHTRVGEWVRVGGTSLALSLMAALCASLDWQRGGRGDQPSAAAARARAERMAKCSSRPLQRRMQVTSDPHPTPKTRIVSCSLLHPPAYRVYHGIVCPVLVFHLSEQPGCEQHRHPFRGTSEMFALSGVAAKH